MYYFNNIGDVVKKEMIVYKFEKNDVGEVVKEERLEEWEELDENGYMFKKEVKRNVEDG